MNTRTAAAALACAAALVLAPVSAAVADGSTTAPGVAKSEAAKAKAAARKLERAAKSRGAVVLGGTVTAVTPGADATQPGSLTFTVHGGRYKVLRGTSLTVAVAPTAKVTRDGVVTLAEVLPGDHVVVKSWRYDFVVTTVPGVDGTAAPTVTVTMTAHRVAASAPETETETDATVVPAV